ncbi:HAD family hydrolase [Blastococcus sp. KM273128]|uniref:HAD family hydrolase n=1 Tax=Blastococcus sp. KM273128 TaxID=2570314 RepID=UPI0035AC0CE0
MQHAGATAVLIEVDGQLGGRGELRPEAAEVVAQLRRDAYTAAMLTGDNTATATAMTRARKSGIEHAHAELPPENKACRGAEVRGQRRTAMVGDGVNDTPSWGPRWARWAPISPASVELTGVVW